MAEDSSLLPEQRARVWIDEKLKEAGWEVVDRKEVVPGMNAAVREALMKGKHEADYLLLLNGKAVAVIEAKRNEIPLDDPDLIRQAEGYAGELLDWFPTYESPLKLVYLSNGKEIAFRDFHREASEYEYIDDFPKPKDIVGLLNLPGYFDGLPYLSREHLRECQYKAILNLERSFKEGKRKALMVLATGSGKTFTACMIAYRMLAYTKAKRVLFLVDRNNLGRAAKSELQSFKLTDTGKNFSEIYSVEQLTNKPLPPETNVVVSTIQRLYAQLSGQLEEMCDEEKDNFQDQDGCNPVDVPEKPVLPCGYFDLIIIDECHRSIYSDWRKVLEYFSSALKVGMTATPIPETLAFFDKNLVCDYTLEESIRDGINVPYRIYRIKTEIGEGGGTVKKGEGYNSINQKTGEVKARHAAEEHEYAKTDLNRSVVVPDQIRKVLEEYRDAVYTRMYPEREPNYDYLPKTLIFAANDIHASSIVQVAKDVFKREDDKFVQKITYSVGDTAMKIRSFRQDRDFRIAVTVTLIATGTDVRPLEVLIFMNDVHSETLYTQMKGRGVRTIKDEELRSVTPNASAKELFYVIDAVGVTESEKHVPSGKKGKGDGEGEIIEPLNLSLEALFEQLSLGRISDHYLKMLADKLAFIQNRSDREDIEELLKLWPTEPKIFAGRIIEALRSGELPAYETAGQDENVERMDLIRDLLDNIPARKLLIKLSRGSIKDLVEQRDEVLSAGFSVEEARKSTEAFEKYVKDHQDDIEALRLIYNSESGKLSRSMIEELERKLSSEIEGFGVSRLWGEYQLLVPEKVKAPRGRQAAITDLIQLVRFAYQQIGNLFSLPFTASQRFELWCGQKQRSSQLTKEQKELFKEIAFYIAQNGSSDFKTLYNVLPELATSLIRILKNAEAANEQIYSLNEFILKAA